MIPIPRVNILGVGISAINLPGAVEQVDSWIRERHRTYVNMCTVHTVMECRRSRRLAGIVNRSGMATPDGMPLVWLSRLQGFSRTGRVYGPDLMLALCDHGQQYRHYFYGGKPGVADELATALSRRYPEFVVAGTYSPPFRAADAPEEPEILDRINAARPDIVWVGLGTPKQDYWIARHRGLLEAPVLIAVGAAFDIHAGRLPQAPRWVRQVGLEWLFRLFQEPRRLAARYLINNPLFILEILLQLSRLREYRLVDSSDPVSITDPREPRPR